MIFWLTDKTIVNIKSECKKKNICFENSLGGGQLPPPPPPLRTALLPGIMQEVLIK